ncbi:MAG TPA: Hsp70 family protein, partial [Pirellulales bacterium]|nr:Hsp70 family protein [Pirellulales bacterium]
ATLSFMAEYAIGIDLGTTNSVLAYAPLAGEAPTINILPALQLVASSTIEPRPLLPSFMYLATDAERSAKAFDLPWAEQRDFAVGELARRQSADVPMRTVAAAKSWLSQSRFDRHAALLPFGAPPEVPKVSPVTASRRYLQHLVDAWHAAMPNAPIAEQQVVVAVPASFDAAARELTREAAIAAGLPSHLVLLEEPQAAVYAWLADAGDRWRRQLKVGDVLLVCDVGGGTTDFTLIRVREDGGELFLERIAVGNHLLVGGDNMDLALAHQVAEAFRAKGIELDPWQSVSLWHACRAAKESLLASDGPKKHQVSILGRGSKLIGGTVTTDVDRKAAMTLLADGFFPACSIDDRPQPRRASGFRQLGLPYESDTAITRHLAAFLAANGDERGEPIRPTHVLFNGGVFKADALRERLFDVLGGWFGKQAKPRGLEGNHDLDLAVARGAVYYAVAKQGRGVRIRGGAARSYYVGIESAGLAIPGAERPLQALCVVPFGMEEGTEIDVPGEEIGLVIGEPAKFRFFSSALRKDDQVGTVLRSWSETELAETDSLETALERDEALSDPYAPVQFRSKITELGVFELWCVSTTSDHRWKLEFSVREDAET